MIDLREEAQRVADVAKMALAAGDPPPHPVIILYNDTGQLGIGGIVADSVAGRRQAMNAVRQLAEDQGATAMIYIADTWTVAAEAAEQLDMPPRLHPDRTEALMVLSEQQDAEPELQIFSYTRVDDDTVVWGEPKLISVGVGETLITGLTLWH